MAQYCKRCDRIETEDELSFCYKCGDRLRPENKCCECGRELMTGIDIYCPMCGKKVELEND